MNNFSFKNFSLKVLSKIHTKNKILFIYGLNNNIKFNNKINKTKIFIVGNNNDIIIEENSSISNLSFTIKGNNNIIHIKSNVIIQKADIWIEDNCCQIVIASDTTIVEAHLAITENNRKILIGNDCMLSSGIELRTGDSHSIIDKDTGQRINYASDIILEDKVWVGSKVSILKGVKIGIGCIIGTGSIVSRSIPPYSIAAGVPAKVIKTNVFWLRDRL